MRSSEIASRLTGISTPIFECPVTSSSSRIAACCTRLTKRRYLSTASSRFCVSADSSQYNWAVAASRRTLPPRYVRRGPRPAGFSTPPIWSNDREAGWTGQIVGSAGWRFNQALGEMRGVFGIHVARLAVAYWG